MKFLKKISVGIAIILLINSENLFALSYENEEIENNQTEVESAYFENSEINVQNNNVSTVNQNTVTKTLYTLPSVSDIAIAGTNRGNGHDKQHLDIYMPAGSSFKIRQVNPSTNLTLSCLNNDSQTEQAFTILKTGEWVEITATVDSVPFISTAYGLTENPVVEIKDKQETQDLTYYTYGENEQTFFDTWNTNNHSYAVIESERATFLIPIKDRESIVKSNGNSYQFKKIDELLEYYDDFIEQFDRYIGLSDNATNSLHKNVKSKFFVKANKHGAGAAYYGGSHTAQNGDTLSAYLSKGWLSLHEVSHGYEGSLANQDLALVDVMNNILSHYYQITFLEENDGGWLGKKINIEGSMKTARETVSNFNEFSYSQKLYAFVNVLDKIGPEKSMAYLHSKYREYIKQGIKYNASDMYSKAFSEVSGYNVIPYMNSVKIMPSVDIQSEIYEKELPMVYYLRDLVATDEKATAIRQELNLEGNYSVVANSDIEKYGMKGNLNIHIDIDNFNQIKDKKIYIKDGEKVIKEVVVSSQDIRISDLPAGIYTLQLPNTKTEAYKHSYEYVVIQENNETIKEVNYTKINESILASDTKILFLGLGDGQFATVTADLENNKLNINSSNTSPHVYFTDEYANIQVLDKTENVIYEKSYIGNTASPSDDTVNVEYGYKIKIKHREATGRLVFKSNVLNENEEFKNLTTDATTYVFTKYGLQKEGTTDDEQYEIYKRKVEKYIQKMQSNISDGKQKNKYYYFIQRNNLLSAILNLKELDQTKYLSQNTVLLNGSKPVIQEIQTMKFECGDDLKILPTNFSATDLEDENMVLNDENTQTTHSIPIENGKVNTEGTYVANVTVRDLDNNIAEKQFSVVVTKKAEVNNNLPQNPSEGNNPSTNPTPENGKQDDILKEEIKNEQQAQGNDIQSENQKTYPFGILPYTGTTSNVLSVCIVILVADMVWKFIRMKRVSQKIKRNIKK